MVATVETAARAVRRPPLRMRIGRWFGTLLIAAGVLVLAWAFVVWKWNDPFTGFYTHLKQQHLRAEYKQLDETYRPFVVPTHHHTSAAQLARQEAKIVQQEARRYRLNATVGKPIGRIIAPRLGLRMILVNGTDHDSLTAGPGRDARSFMPGEGKLVYIAGHRTTYLAPFANINTMRVGDQVTLAMPYATFVYSVTGHVIVDAHDLSVLRSHNREILALQACHPRFFATHRYIVWAKLIEVRPRQGQPYAPAAAATSARAQSPGTTP
jgi:sortase A